MNNCTSFLLLLAAACFCISCKRSVPTSTIAIRGGDETVISVDFDQVGEQPFDLSPYIDSVRYIALETSDTALVSRIKKVNVANGLLYIHDSAKKIVVYDTEGRFIYQIDALGLGPQEYSSIHDFCVYRGQVEILDLDARKLLRYRAEDGDFIESVSLQSFFYHFLPVPGHNYLADIHLYLQDEGMGTLLLDSLTNQRERLLSFAEHPTFANNINAFSALKDSVYGIFSQVDYTVYHFTYPQTLERKYVYRFNQGLSLSARAGKRSVELSAHDMDELIMPSFYKESHLFILLQLVYQSKGIEILYDKQTGETTVSPALLCRSLQCIELLPTDTSHLLASVVQPFQLELMKHTPKEQIPPPLRNGALYDIALQSREDSNPVIQLIYLKHE
ncbi:MAG: 6-bladed beta-propeller [Lachnospiraceae bacterium]|jgi:hypothetical protein|nr:6-bladed beta-propeller [Lachnospiraceae bacterium]